MDLRGETLGVAGGCLDADHIWCQVMTQGRSEQLRPALFLDRDGVIVEEVGYLHRVEDVKLIGGAAETIAAANRRGLPVVVVSNQAGIARGYYGWNEFRQVQAALLDQLALRGASIDAVFACPYHPAGVGRYARASHPARKPEPGMLLRAAEMLRLDLERSWIIGDKSMDLMAGQAAGLCGGLLVLTGHGGSHRDAAAKLRSPEFQVLIGDSIRDAATLIDLLG